MSPQPSPTVSGSLGRVGLSVVSLSSQGDGIAYAARLLHRAMRDVSSALRVRELAPAGSDGVTPLERARFVGALLGDHLRERADGWIYNHVGIARAQRCIPPLLRRPYAVFLNGIEAWDPELPEDRKRVLRGAAARIAISGHTASRVSAVHPDIGPIRACPLALLPPEPVAGVADRELLSRVGERSVLILGRMSAAERYKGHDQLLEAWPRVLAEVPDAQLVVAGGGDDVERLRRKAGEAGISDRVLFAGFVPDATLHHLWERVALFAMPSRGEGFGLVYLQAMRAGLACIGSTKDAAGEVIANGETGHLVDPDDREGLARTLARALRDKGERRALGEAGRRRFEAEFTYERFRERLRPLLLEAFGGAGRGRRGCAE